MRMCFSAGAQPTLDLPEHALLGLIFCGWIGPMGSLPFDRENADALKRPLDAIGELWL